MAYTLDDLIQRRDVCIEFGITEFDSNNRDLEAARFFAMAADLQVLLESPFRIAGALRS